MQKDKGRRKQVSLNAIKLAKLAEIKEKAVLEKRALGAVTSLLPNCPAGVFLRRVFPPLKCL